MGKFLSRFRGQDNEGNNSNSSLSDSDECTDDQSCDTHNKKTQKRKKRVKKQEPTDGWEEICGIDIDVLEDIMTTKKQKIRQSGRLKLEENVKVPTVDENRERLQNAYNLWLKYRPENSEVYMPRWENILERTIIEQSVLVDEYVRRVFYLLELEDIPDYKISDMIPKDEILIRDPNKPGTYITFAEALKRKEKRQNIKPPELQKDIIINMPSSSQHILHDSNEKLDLPKRTYSHKTV